MREDKGNGELNWRVPLPINHLLFRAGHDPSDPPFSIFIEHVGSWVLMECREVDNVLMGKLNKNPPPRSIVWQ